MARSKSIANATTAELERELQARMKHEDQLFTERSELLKRLAELDRKIKRVTKNPNGKIRRNGRVQRGRRGRIKDQAPLSEYIQRAVGSKEMTIDEITAKIKELGFKTRSKNFRNVVNQTLIRHPEIVKKVDRGLYVSVGSNRNQTVTEEKSHRKERKKRNPRKEIASNHKN